MNSTVLQKGIVQPQCLGSIVPGCANGDFRAAEAIRYGPHNGHARLVDKRTLVPLRHNRRSVQETRIRQIRDRLCRARHDERLARITQCHTGVPWAEGTVNTPDFDGCHGVLQSIVHHAGRCAEGRQRRPKAGNGSEPPRSHEGLAEQHCARCPAATLINVVADHDVLNTRAREGVGKARRPSARVHSLLHGIQPADVAGTGEGHRIAYRPGGPGQRLQWLILCPPPAVDAKGRTRHQKGAPVRRLTLQP